MMGWGLPWLLLGLAGGASPVAEPVRIQADALHSSTLSSGQIHVYKLPLEAGDYARLEVIQQGLDVETLVRGPSGQEVAEVDTTTGRFSTENVSLIAKEKGEYEIEVQTRYPGETGNYKLIVAALHKAGQDDRLRVEAEQAGRKVSGVDGARLVIEKWRALGDRVHETRALTRLGAALDKAKEWPEALRIYEQALSIQRELQDREGMDETLSQMGRTLRAMGEGRRALAALEESLALRQELGRPDLAATTLCMIGQVHESFGGAEAALAAYERSLTLARQAGAKPQQALALTALGGVRFQLGDTFHARDDSQEALDLARAIQRRDTEAQALSNLGSVYRRLGMPHDALEHYTAARDIAHELGKVETEAIALNNIGMLFMGLGAYGDAREILEQALPLQRSPSNQAMTRIGLSRIAEETGDAREAAVHIDEALKIQRNARDRAGEAESLRSQGLLFLKLGRKAEAEERLRESVAIYRELGRRSGAAASLRGLARVQAALGRIDEARKLYEESRRQSEVLGDVGDQVLTLGEEGRLEHESGNLAEARKRLEAALELMETFRSEVGGESLRALHFATVRETYERYIDVLMQLHGSDPGADLDAKAFEVAEQSRARGLLDVLARARVDTREGDPKTLAKELRLRQELNDKAELRMGLGDDEASRARSEALRQEIDKLAVEHRIVEALLTDGSSYESLKKPSLPVPEIQRLLDSDTVLLEYLLAEPRSYLWVVGPDSLQAFELPGRQDIGELARRLHERLKDPADRDPSGQRTDRQLLAKMVLGPALPAIAGKRLVIVPDGALHYVPFAALLVAPSVTLIEEHEISLLPSAAVIKEIRRAGGARSPRPASLAIVADPVYAGGLEELTWTRTEAEAIQTAARGREVKVALRHEATKELITSGELDRFRTLHIATHGFFDGDHPQLSSLAFSQVDAQGQPLNGHLRLQDLYSLRLQSELVVLSGCETGLGRELRGEGLVGLTHGFFHAGASQVVASLWPVRDKASAELMKRFYGAMIRDRLRPAAALRAAQIEMLKDKNRTWRDPYFWAAFVAQGDWTAGGL